MMRALIVLAVACDAPRPPPPPAPVPVLAHDATLADAGMVDAAPIVPVVAPDAAPYKLGGSTAAWKRGAKQLADDTSRFVAGWGTVRLDGEVPIRFATLLPHGMGERGAYLFELAPHHVVEISFYADGRTTVFGNTTSSVESTAVVPFSEEPDTSIVHLTGHHHGGESLTFGLRGGELVVFTYAYTDDITDHSEKPIDQKFPNDFACRPRCPDLATFRTYLGSQLGVSKPARSIGELVDPGPSSGPAD